MKVIEVNVQDHVHIDTLITACIGYFDGVHLGHQQLIRRVISITQNDGTIPALITFDPDPWAIVKKQQNISHLTTMSERMRIGERMGLSLWIILHFDEEMASLSIEAFHELLYKKLHVKTLVCGYDFSYASRGQGTCDSLIAQNLFACDIVDAITFEDEKISSSRIEKELAKGDVNTAAKLLGRYYAISGEVVHGSQIGRTFGYPTANVKTLHHYVLPKRGVYAGYAIVKGKRYGAFINIGYNPSFNLQDTLSLEAHIFDFDNDIYGEMITIQFVEHLRDEQKFSGIEALAKQLACDKEKALSLIEETKEESVHAS